MLLKLSWNFNRICFVISVTLYGTFVVKPYNGFTTKVPSRNSPVYCKIPTRSRGVLGRKRRQRQRDAAYARQIKSIGDVARNSEGASLRKNTDSRGILARDWIIFVIVMPTFQSAVKLRSAVYQVRKKWKRLDLPGVRSRSFQSGRRMRSRATDTRSASCRCTLRCHPRTADLLPQNIATGSGNNFQHSPTDRIDCLQTTGSM